MVKSNVGKPPPAASTIMNDDEFENFFQLLDARRVNFREGPRPDVVYPASPAREATRPQMEWGSGGGGDPVPSPARQHKVHHRCGTCRGCTSSDCGLCKNCKDKPRCAR